MRPEGRDSGGELFPAERSNAGCGSGRPGSRHATSPDARSRASRRVHRASGSVVLCVAAITALRPARVPPQERSRRRPLFREPAVASELGRGRTREPSRLRPRCRDRLRAEPAKPAAPPEIDRAAVARPRPRSTRPAAIVRGPTIEPRITARRLSQATGQAALDAARARKLAFLVRDPSTRITQASTRGGFLKGERDKLQKELSTLRQLPRPKSASILSKAPVAKPAFSNEYHFELRHNRITFINLERLMELTRADAQVRIRMSDRSPVDQQQGRPGRGVFTRIRAGAGGPGKHGRAARAQEHPVRAQRLGAVAGIGKPRRDLRVDPRPAFRVFARDQPAQPGPVDHHAVGLSGQLHPLPPDPQRAHRARLQRGRPAPARRHDDPRQPDGNAVSGTVRRNSDQDGRNPNPNLNPNLNRS